MQTCKNRRKLRPASLPGLLCALLVGALLVGCGDVRLLPQQGKTDAADSAAAPAAQTLAAYVEPDFAGGEALLAAYTQSRGLSLQLVDSPDSAGISLFAACPEGDGWRSLTGDMQLAAALPAGVKDHECAFPLGGTAYGYLADTTMLQSLLGSDSFGGLQNATWQEWQDFVETTAEWLQAPAQTTVTLGGTEYTLPAQKDANTLLLQSVFALPQTGAHGMAALAPALAAGEDGSGEQQTALAAAWEAFSLETTYAQAVDSTADALSLLQNGGVLFCRAELSRAGAALAAQPELAARLALIPTGQEQERESSSAVWQQAGWAAISAAAPQSDADQGFGFLLWLCASTEGDTALAETLNVITPRGTAPQTPLGTLQADWQSGSAPAGEAFPTREAALETAYADSADGKSYAEAVFAAMTMVYK